MKENKIIIQSRKEFIRMKVFQSALQANMEAAMIATALRLRKNFE